MNNKQEGKVSFLDKVLAVTGYDLEQNTIFAENYHKCKFSIMIDPPIHDKNAPAIGVLDTKTSKMIFLGNRINSDVEKKIPIGHSIVVSCIKHAEHIDGVTHLKAGMIFQNIDTPPTVFSQKHIVEQVDEEVDMPKTKRRFPN